MKKIIRNKWVRLLFVIIVLLIIIPAVMQLVINLETSSKGSDDGWLGFWGGYLGSIIGIAGALFVVQIQLNEDKTGRETEKIDNTYFNLLSMHNEQKSRLIDNNIFENIYYQLEVTLKSQLLDEGLSCFYLEKKLVIDKLQELIRTYKKYIENNEGEISDEFSRLWERKKRGEMFSDSDEYPITEEAILYDNLDKSLKEIKDIENFLKDIENEKFNQFSNRASEGVYDELIKHIENSRIIEWDIPKDLIEFKKKIGKYKSDQLELLPDSKKRKGIEIAINNYYGEIGAYFRIFHRIIKYINDKVIDEETKKDYLGFLRATINETELLVIFYNAAYTERGEGLLKEIRKTTFFGDYQELLENGTVQHFNSNSLIWKADDLKIMREFGNKA